MENVRRSRSRATNVAGKAHRGVSTHPVLRLASLFAVFTLLPLALITYFTIHLADRAVVHEVDDRAGATAMLAAAMIQQQMTGVENLTNSYANRPLVVSALADGNPARFDGAAIEQQLMALASVEPGIAGAFVTDTQCRRSQVVPPRAAIAGVDFSFRDWCQGITASGRAYVSSAYQTAIADHPLVVAVAATVRAGGDPAGKPLGILSVVYTLDAIRSFAAQVASAQGIHLLITDQHGMVLDDGATQPKADLLVSAAKDPRVQAGLAGRSGETRSRTAYGDTLSAYAPVATLGWTVTAEIPSKSALAGVRRLDSSVLGAAGVLGLVLLVGIVALARSLWRRKEIELTMRERQSHLHKILEAATDAFVSIDDAGSITAWNPRAEEIFGWTEAEVLGRQVSETIIPPDAREAHTQGLARFLTTGEGPVLNKRIEVTALRRDGRTFLAELAIWPVRSGDKLSFNAFIQDITERKRVEMELATARDDALAASKQKSEFLANMSHEIRTPMNGVLGMTSLLLETDLTKKQREFAGTALVSGEALLQILNDILDFSKIEAGRLDLESVDFNLRSLMEGAASMLSLSAHKKGLELVCSLPDDLPVMVRGDPGRLCQVVTNLIGNAVKFTSSGDVLLRVTMLQAEPIPLARVEVVDTGVGIAETDFDRIFESFSQAEAGTTRRFGGTGLGLSISRQLVELMGGEMGVDSELGHGSTFWFTVPIPKARHAPPSVPAATLDGLHVLIVDDNATNRTILTHVLQSWGVRSDAVDGAPHAWAALTGAMALSDPFDAVLLDLNMPGVNGFELARSIGADSALAPIKLIMLTSSSDVGKTEGLDAGISGYLTKPVCQSELFELLASPDEPPMEDDARSRGLQAMPQPPTTRLQGRVLVVEDNTINQKVAATMLENLGLVVDVVTDGAQAVDAAMQTPYDAILMDCQMPVMDGYQATLEIRRLEERSPRTTIIALTASAMLADERRCADAGMDDYLAKPFSQQSLESVLVRYIGADPQVMIVDHVEAHHSAPAQIR